MRTSTRCCLHGRGRYRVARREPPLVVTHFYGPDDLRYIATDSRAETIVCTDTNFGHLDQVLPAGDLSIFADLGLDEMDLGMIAGDLDLFPDEALAIIARKLGFGQALERALTLALGRVP